MGLSIGKKSKQNTEKYKSQHAQKIILTARELIKLGGQENSSPLLPLWSKNGQRAQPEGNWPRRLQKALPSKIQASPRSSMSKIIWICSATRATSFFRSEVRLSQNNEFGINFQLISPRSPARGLLPVVNILRTP